MLVNQNSRDYFEWGDREDLAYDEKLAKYRELADAYFQVEEYQEFCARHLAHVDEVAHDWFSSQEFDDVLVEHRALDVSAARAGPLRRALPRPARRLGARQRLTS